MSHFYLPPAAIGFSDESEWQEYLENYESSDVNMTMPEAKSYVIDSVPVHIPQRTAERRSHWVALHQHIWQSEELARQFFATWWDKKPKSCKCKDADAILADNPMDFDCDATFFASGVRLHNAVSAKPELAETHPQVSLEDAITQWRTRPSQTNKPVMFARKQAIATALSPNRIDRQVLCIKTWLASGFKVIANQTDKEMESFPKVFHEISDLIEWRVNNDVESFYDFKTQKIRNLLAIENAILINSDCEMAGEYDWQSGDWQSGEVSTFFLRWNYKPGQEPREFEWGIDGAWLTREAWTALPEDFPYCIGQAMWDYAVPHILKIKGIPFRIDHKAWLFHEEHKQNWTQAYWQKGVEWLEANGYHSLLQYSDGFRQSLDPDWYYDYNRGFWVKKEIQ